MKIVCPTNTPEEIEELITHGAQEFYLGYIPQNWKRKFSHIASSNRRYFPESSFHDFKNIAKAVSLAQKYDVPVNMAINGSYYMRSQYPTLLKQIKKAAKAGVDSIICADIPLMLKIKQQVRGIDIIASTCTSSFNSESVKFYENLGTKRLILPRHLTIPEIRTIRSSTKIELELLGLFDWCIYDDGMCTFHHGMEDLLGVSHGCSFVHDYALIRGNSVQRRIIDNRIKNVVWDHFCAACLINTFEKIGINSFKIAGRRFPTEEKVRALNFLKQCSKEDNQNNHEQLYFNTFQRRHPLNANAYL